MASPAPSFNIDLDNTSDPGSDYNPEFQVTGNWKIVDLPPIVIQPPESNYTLRNSFEARLFRFREGEWKDRGEGELKFLQHKQNGKVVLVLRSRKTFLLRANHFIHKSGQLCNLTKSLSHSNSWQWRANDISDSAPSVQHFSIQLRDPQQSSSFCSQFHLSCLTNESLL